MRIYPSGTTAEDFTEDEIPDYSNTERYRTDQSVEEVLAILRRIKSCVKQGRFIVCGGAGREENQIFINAYGLYTRNAQRRLLLSLDTSHFCHAIRAADGDELYVFCIRHNGYKALIGPCSVMVYVKHRCPPSASPYDWVISMHELRYPIDLLFGD